jgi:hypothetical protein
MPEPPKKIIDLVDLGAGDRFERTAGIARRRRISRAGTALRPRRVVAVDIRAHRGELPEGMEYKTADATKYLASLPDASVGAINGEQFFHQQVLYKAGRNLPDSRSMYLSLLENPIDPELLGQIKRALMPRGRLFATTTKWHANLLIKKFKEAGFNVGTVRPLTHDEIMSGPETNRSHHEWLRDGRLLKNISFSTGWNGDDMNRIFGPDGWELYRMELIKKE